jgi:predicted ATP-grasp superfamily ATP-dependent carboligase
VRRQRVMVVTTQTWPTGARICVALSKVGFEVAAVTPLRGLIRKATLIRTRYTYWPFRPRASLLHAVRDWSPDFLVCVDDEAVRQLHDLHRRETTCGNGTSKIASLIEFSLGKPAAFAQARERSTFILSSQCAGVRCPKTIVVSDQDTLESSLGSVTYPIVVKADGTYGGLGVGLAKDEIEARKLVDTLARGQRTVSMQEYIVGRPANRAVVCLEGKVLAGISVEALETRFDFGPASVVRVIDQPEMTAAADRMVAHLGLSGFVGFDFILDRENRAWLLEMNARVTPTCHICFADGTDLPAALYQRMSGVKVTRTAPSELKNTIVLFPQGLLPSRQSLPLSPTYLASYHDVPWEEPALVRASLDFALKRPVVERLHYRFLKVRKQLFGAA